MSEHAGGAPEIGFEDGPDGSPCRVRILRQDYEESLLDLMREHIDSGREPWEFVESFFGDELRALTCETIRKFLCYFRGSKNRAMLADQFHWISGGALAYDGDGIGKLAKRHGVSKQAFHRGASKIREEFLSVRSQTERAPEAREKMSQRTTRRVKP